MGLLDTIAAVDWITPTIALIQDALEGEAKHFGVMAGVFDRNDIQTLLSNYGVKSWGYVYNVSGDLLMFSVKKQQFKWAKYILIRKGVPVLYEDSSQSS